MAKEKISIFGKKPIAATPKKTDKTIVNVDGLEEKLLEFDFMKSQMEDLKAQLEAVTDEIKDISKEKFIELYTNKRTNPNTFLIKDGEGCVMVIPQDRYTKIKEEERAEYLKSQYGDEVITEDIKYVFNNEVLERNMKAIETLISNAKNISDYDKKNLITPIIEYSVAKGFIDKIYEYEDMQKVLDDIQPVIALKNCGGKMELGGETDYNDFITNIYDEEDKFEYGGETDSDFIANIYEDGGTTCGCSHKEGGELFNPYLKPTTYKVFNENELVLKTQSFNKAVDYRVLNGKHLKIIAIDKNGNAKVIASSEYSKGGGVGEDAEIASGKKSEILKRWAEKGGRDSAYSDKIFGGYSEHYEITRLTFVINKLNYKQREELLKLILEIKSNKENSDFYGSNGDVKQMSDFHHFDLNFHSWKSVKVENKVEYLDYDFFGGISEDALIKIDNFLNSGIIPSDSYYFVYNLSGSGQNIVTEYHNKSEYSKGGGVGMGYGNEIPKEELESKVGRKLNGWNDDKIEYNGKVYEKCFLKPYYKIIN